MDPKDYLRKIGRRGGMSTLKKHGRKKMTEWGKLGGRGKKRLATKK